MSKLVQNPKSERRSGTIASQERPSLVTSFTKVTKVKKSSGGKKIKLNVFAIEAFLYLLTQFLGLIAAVQISRSLPQLAEMSRPQISWPRFLVYFVFGTILILIFLRLSQRHTRFFFELIFALAVFSGSQIIFGLLMPDFWAMFCAALLVIIRFLHPSVLTQNLVMILAIAGIGAVIGLSLTTISVIIVLMVLSVYDFIAVYKTKHMVKMAKQMMQQRVLLAYIIPQTITGFKGDLKDVKIGGRLFILGSGDVVMPLVAVAAMSRFSLAHALVVLLFAFLGLLLMHLIFNLQRIRRPMAALPPIALFTILGILVSVLVLGI